MKVPTKVTLDTNVLISALLTPGNSRKIVELSARRKILLFSSPEIEGELRRTLRDKLKYDNAELAQALIVYRETVHKVVYPKKKLKVVTSDKTDNRILEAASEGNVGYAVTGDKHLLGLGKYKKILILNPSGFLNP